MTDDGGLRAALRHQGRACAELGSPFMARLMDLLAGRLAPGTPLTDRAFGWPGDLGPHGASVPLRLAGALHRLRLDGDPRLAAVYPPENPDDAILWRALDAALRDRAAEIDRLLDSAPQTNEVRRSTALIAAAHWLGARFPLPLTLSEAGASAGLNLMFDRFAVATPAGRLGPASPALTLEPDWHGRPPPAGPAPTVTDRRGCDLAPVDPVADRLRLLSYLWPDQPERIHLTEAAIATAGARVDRACAADWIAMRLSRPWTGLHMVFHTVAWQYFPPDVQARATAAIEAAGTRASSAAPLAWIAMEADGAGPGAALTARLWPGGSHHVLGRVDFHGRWVDWQADPL